MRYRRHYVLLADKKLTSEIKRQAFLYDCSQEQFLTGVAQAAIEILNNPGFVKDLFDEKIKADIEDLKKELKTA